MSQTSSPGRRKMAERIILDLAEFNRSVKHRHFKMDNLGTAINLISKGYFMASIDWKDAYDYVPIAKDSQKYLQLLRNYKVYMYTSYPNGLSSVPRNFTKITKVLFANFRERSHVCTWYINVCLLFGKNVQECRENVRVTIDISTKAGFVIHHDKSQFEPTTRIVYLGFLKTHYQWQYNLTWGESAENKIGNRQRSL